MPVDLAERLGYGGKGLPGELLDADWLIPLAGTRTAGVFRPLAKVIGPGCLLLFNNQRPSIGKSACRTSVPSMLGKVVIMAPRNDIYKNDIGVRPDGDATYPRTSAPWLSLRGAMMTTYA